MKQCTRCCLLKLFEEFSPNAKGAGGRASRCKQCARELAGAHYTKPGIKESRRAYSARPDVRVRERLARKNERYRLLEAERQRKYRNNARIKVLALLGGACSCCSESFPPFLEMHHLNTDGRAHRSEGGTLRAMKSIISGAYPLDRLTILCANCHTAITRHGSCEKHNP